MASWTKQDLLTALEASHAPAGPVNDIAEALADPEVQARGMKIQPEGIPGLWTPLRFSDGKLTLDRASPRLGEDDEVLGGLPIDGPWSNRSYKEPLADKKEL